MFPKLSNRFDLYCGTSAGSFNALGFAMGLGSDPISSIWTQNLVSVFKKVWFQNIESLAEAPYSTELLRSMLITSFSGTLSQLPKKVVIPTFCLDKSSVSGLDKTEHNWGPVVQSNFNPIFADLPIVDAALRSSAAPTYFPIYQNFIDGFFFFFYFFFKFFSKKKRSFC